MGGGYTSPMQISIYILLFNVGILMKYKVVYNNICILFRTVVVIGGNNVLLFTEFTLWNSTPLKSFHLYF